MDGQVNSSWVGSSHEKLRWIALERIDKFLSDLYWTDINLSRSRFHTQRAPEAVSLEIYSPSYNREDEGRISFEEAASAEYTPIAVGASVGPSWSSHWFRVTLTIPPELKENGQPLHFLWNSDSEALVWYNGQPVQGFTGGNGCDKREEYALPSEMIQEGEAVFFVEMACNSMFGTPTGGMIQPPDPNKTFTVHKAEVAVFDTQYWNLYWDFKVVADMAKDLPEDHIRGVEAMRVANRVINILDVNDRNTYEAASSLLQSFLAEQTGDYEGTVHAVGHCHIDTAWLWPYAETRRKCGRSWATQLALMEKYPGYTFACSQMQQLEWVQQDYPSLFSRVKEAASSGSFELVGGTWVEMDCNMPSGESLIRQFLYGTRYLKKEFDGAQTDVFWLPDTFGYAAQLPQIIRGFGMKYFMSQKLSWNLINTFPHHSFQWKGLDGTAVLTHFPPSDTYNAQVTVSEAIKHQKQYKQKGISRHSLMLFGHGDGGGGPQAEMLERLTRLRNTAPLPRVEHSRASSFFDRLAEKGDLLPVWDGELYFELHRGTYTTHAKLKAMNRECEHRLRQVETLLALAYIQMWSNTDSSPSLAPSTPSREERESKLSSAKDLVEKLWKDVCLNQFHDVLPGSCIARVAEDAISIYENVVTEVQRLTTRLSLSLLGLDKVEADGEERKEQQGEPSIAFNCLQIPCAPGRVGGKTPIPPLSFGEVTPSSQKAKGSEKEKEKETEKKRVVWEKVETGLCVSNDHFTAIVSPQGTITHLSLSGSNRNLASNALNQLRLYDDVPFYWDAWDVMVYHNQTGKTVGKVTERKQEIEEIEGGVCIRTALQLSPTSTCISSVSVLLGDPLIYFESVVEWKEAHKLLKVEFPLSLLSSTATYETQYGHVSRPTHTNTTHDLAKFEVCGHKWADLSEYSMGVSVLADSKYGYSCEGSTLRVSLLRAPKRPDPDADIGQHTIRYALFPHYGSFQQAGVVERALSFNFSPLLVTLPVERERVAHCLSRASSLSSLFHIDGSGPSPTSPPCGLQIDCIKAAEDGSRRVVVRCYESYGGGGEAKFTISRPDLIQSVCLVSMGETPLGDPLLPLPLSGDTHSSSFLLSYSPFEVITLSLSF